MTARIAVIDGHPDSASPHFAHALADAYADGAREAGHEVRRIDVGRLEFPLLRSKAEFDHGVPPDAIQHAQETLKWATHVVILFPLWLGAMPALLKGFLEQTLRPGYAIPASGSGLRGPKPLSGRSARIVVTMGMPAFFYRWYFRAHGVKNLKRNVLAFCGLGPVRDTLIGLAEAPRAGAHDKWLKKMRVLGHDAR